VSGTKGTNAQRPGVARTVAAGVVSPRAGAHLVLVGLPGAGKTSVGRHLAARLRAPFLDFDEEIERRQGKSVARIFSESGEAYFRKLERELTEELQGAIPQILAPGGGWVQEAANLALLRPPARIIHLRVDIGTAISRLGTRRTSRPLLAGDDPVEVMAGLLRERAPHYSRADAEVNTELLAIEEVTQTILAIVGRWGWLVD
jgi:shikimate kinase